jgi:hypothetical protein
MAKNEPVVLELAALPREQIGPFLLLGLAKDADKDLIDAQWAERIKMSRRQALKVPLEDINWAREMLKEPDKRVRADAASLNSDTSDGTLRQLTRRYSGTAGDGGSVWQPLDNEKPLADYMPAVEMPDPNAIRAALTAPEVPEEQPGVALLLERLAGLPLDPWNLDLPSTGAIA